MVLMNISHTLALGVGGPDNIYQIYLIWQQQLTSTLARMIAFLSLKKVCCGFMESDYFALIEF